MTSASSVELHPCALPTPSLYPPCLNRGATDTGVAGNTEVDIDDDELVMSDDHDDFVVQRRDVNAGRAVTSGPVLYSVAESVSQPRWDDSYVSVKNSC